MAAEDNFEQFQAGLSSPAETLETVVADDSVDLTNVTRALWVGTAGNISVEDASGNTVTITNIQDGTLLPIRIVRVNTTDTTASNMVGFS